MSGVLQFSLGLTAGGFASAIAGADGKLKSFVGHALTLPGVGAAVGGLVASFASLHAVVEGVMGAIEKGAGLEKLGKQTGESVGDLFRLQKALGAVDVDAGAAGAMIFNLRRALGGISETGEPTAHIFAQLGMSIDDLKKLDAPAALQAIATRMGKLDASSATSAAGKIFGKMNAREFLVVARSSGEFTEALQKNQKAAALFQRASGSFESIEKNLRGIKNKAQGLFAGLAVGLAPAIESITSALNSIDLTGIGEDLGKVITAFTQAWKEGKLVDLIVETFKLAFDLVVTLAPVAFAKLGIVILKVFEKPLMIIQIMMEQAIQFIMEKLGNLPVVGKQLGLEGFKAQSTEEIAKDRMEKGVEFFSEGNNLDTMNKSINEKLAEDLGSAKERLGSYFTDWINPLVARAPKAKAGTKRDDKQGEALGAGYEVQRTSLEKMGFVMRGGAAADPALQTARNTKEALGHLKTISENLRSTGEPNLANASVS